MTESKHKIGIVGAGAMGCLFAHYFVRANIDVMLYDLPSRIALLKNGIRVALFDGLTSETYVSVSSTPSELNDCSIVFIFVKSYSTRDAALAISPYLNRDTILVTLQNGIGNKEILQEIFPNNRIVYGATTIGAHINHEGIICEGGKGNIIIGSSNKVALENVCALFHATELPVECTSQPDLAVWRKAIINAAINPLGALLGITNGEIILSPQLRHIQKKIIREAVQVASSLGITLISEELVEETSEVCKKTARNRCSMLQDIEAGRKTEIDSINGKIIQLAQLAGISTPYNDAIYCLIVAREAKKKPGDSPAFHKYGID
ncbi:MAG: 2-dehydropantoate 2-reductase [Spirochaetes bacterium]|nr:2-dehydropantoate 2-reductase [Spirochaetota bacterium]